MVNPTNSGGIQVKTANLSWVTSNMIASTLSTSGVVNCEVLAAAPFEVSGTGALTGIIMAYESAVGATLDSAKKEVATQELITTTEIANEIGQVQATEIVNESKMQVIEGQVVNKNEIDIIINDVAEKGNISLSDEDRELLSQLLQEIAQQDYNYEEMKETLERVEQNMQELSKQTEAQPETDIADEAIIVDGGSSFTEPEDDPLTDVYEVETEALAEDSILMNTDDSALGDSVLFDATDDAALNETEAPQTVAPSEDPFEITGSDSYDSSVQVPEEEYTDGEDVFEDDSNELDEVYDVTETLEPIQTEFQEEPADAGITTLELLVLPLSDFEFAPLTAESTSFEIFDAGIDELTVFFQRNDIIGGSGTLMLYDAADSSLIETITMADPEKVAVQPMTEDELAEREWTDGSKAVIKLDAPLAQDMTYFVILSEDALASADGKGHSEAIPDSFTWMIQTSEFGFSLDKPLTGVTAGNTVAGQIMMDNTAAVLASIENADPALVTFDVTEFAASGAVNATFLQAGNVTFSISFYDEAGTQLETIEYEVTVK